MYALALGQNRLELAGQTIAVVLVVRRAPTVAKNARWLVRGACGHEWIVAACTLTTAKDRGHSCRCEVCYRAMVAERQLTNPPKRRGRRGKYAPRPERDPSERMCEQCLDMPWRRPRSLRKLCACGESYAPEEPVCLAYVAAHFMRPERVTVF